MSLLFGRPGTIQPVGRSPNCSVSFLRHFCNDVKPRRVPRGRPAFAWYGPVRSYVIISATLDPLDNGQGILANQLLRRIRCRQMHWSAAEKTAKSRPQSVSRSTQRYA